VIHPFLRRRPAVKTKSYRKNRTSITANRVLSHTSKQWKYNSSLIRIISFSGICLSILKLNCGPFATCGSFHLRGRIEQRLNQGSKLSMQAQNWSRLRILWYLRCHLLLSWTSFPAVWFLSATSIISRRTESMMYLLADFSAKVRSLVS
jgi:hypothetical protein